MRYRVGRGIKVGVLIATCLSVWAAVAFALKNRAQLDAMHITLPQVVIAYLAGGIFGGAFVGVAFPITRWAIGAFMLGFIAILPTAVVMVYFMARDIPGIAQVIVACIVACIGGALALYIRSDPWPE